jgi:Rieske Fe-S protein
MSKAISTVSKTIKATVSSARPVTKSASNVVTNTATAKTVNNPASKAVAAKTVKVETKSKIKAPIKAAPAKPVATAKPEGTKAAKSVEKPKKIKLVRDSFTLPKNELNVLGDLKLRALSMSLGVKKSELLRAGIKALAGMSDAQLTAAIKAVPTLKTGRPKK